MARLSYEDYKNRINIKDLLEYAGYHFNRRDGLRYPTFVRLDNEGHRIKGDKYIVTANGMACFRPPEKRTYNIISFIKEHPELFAEYQPGMDKDRLVNKVCRRLLGQPEEAEWQQIKDAAPDIPFDLKDYDVVKYDKEDKDNVKTFFPYFRQRGINLPTQAAFADYFFLATNLKRSDGRRFTNMAFPFRTPLSQDIVGLEVRSVKNKDGSSYKGKALGTDSVNGLWIASPAHTPIKEAKDVLWFESAYDAMSYYQLICKGVSDGKKAYHQMYEDKEIPYQELKKQYQELNTIQKRFNHAVYVSTGGNPSEQQMKGMLKAAPEARHLLCFDNDKAGIQFCMNFLMVRNERYFNSFTSPEGRLVIIDRSQPGQNDRYDFDPAHLTFSDFAEFLKLNSDNVIRFAPNENYKDWNDQLLDIPIEVQKSENENTQAEDAQRTTVLHR